MKVPGGSCAVVEVLRRSGSASAVVVGADNVVVAGGSVGCDVEDTTSEVTWPAHAATSAARRADVTRERMRGLSA